MPLTIGQIGIIPSLERFVSTNYLLRHFVVLAILSVGVLSASIGLYCAAIYFGRPTQFSSSDPRLPFQSDSGGRDTMDIISACSSTLITCVYSSVHFNIPRGYAHRLPFSQKIQSKDYWLDLWGKATFWLLGIFSPEMLVLHAYYEHMIARRDVKWMREHGHEGWTMTHAFFADMGGFVTEDGRELRSGFALHDTLLRSPNPGWVDFEELEYDIADRTKADLLFKIITSIQVLRFFVEVIVRTILKLPVAPLETVTCAYVICTLLYYGLWIPKPYNVNEHIVIRMQPATLRRARKIEESDVDAREKTSRMPPAFKRFWDKYIVPCLEPHMTEADRQHGSANLYQSSPCELFIHHALQLWHILTTIVDMTHGSLIAAAAGLLVGLAHLACWNVEFPNNNGQVLWRYCSVALIVLPVVVFIIILGAAIIDKRWVTRAMNMIALPLITLYCVARIILLILIGHSFQSLPAGVYDTSSISWISFIPFYH